VQRARRTKKRPFKFGPSMFAARHRGVLLEHPFALGKLRRIPRDPAGWRGASTPPRANRGARWQGCAQLACS
jgi:hypothetical protein